MALVSDGREPLRVGYLARSQAGPARARCTADVRCSLTNALSVSVALGRPVGGRGCGRAKGGGLMAEFGECYGVHPVPPRPDAVPVQWGRKQKRAGSVRVRAYTCDCVPVFFEQCVAGGLGFVRRYDRTGAAVVIADSPWVRVSEAQLLWQRLMTGEAR